MKSAKTNRLIDETSPYLLQHAHNPVNWYPWGDEALTKAKQEDKPILVSIGYAACHWCHVMERESFEDESTAQIMNEHFINIKIDREERPDLDHIYMDAVQAITGSGGWPLNVFLTPDAKPFYGGTYFPPQRAFNRSSWKETLHAINQAYKERRHEINAQAENLTSHLLEANTLGLKLDNSDDLVNPESLIEIAANMMKLADKQWGGFGKAPKFPQTFTIQYLLRYNEHKEGTDQAFLSLDKMIEGGIYDQIGGGFARYSTDTEWLAPHFEKMLYDNALLVSVLSEAFQLTHKKRYEEVIHETMEFVRREMTHPSGGFYAALDADSEGEEGKFYVWDYEEAKKILKEDANIFFKYYDITEAGNFEHKNILRVKTPMEKFAVENQIDLLAFEKIIERGKQLLMQEREKRVRPLLDDKIILGWNALMNTATSKAFAATGREEYRTVAVRNMEFLLSNFKAKEDNSFHHTWKNNQAKFPAFLDDYAYLIQALISLQEITSDKKYLLHAKDICAYVIEKFSDEEAMFFYYTESGQSDVIIRKKELFDGATPAGNAIMAYNLYLLSVIFDVSSWRDRSVNMVSRLGSAITKYPTSFGNWAALLHEFVKGTSEIAVVGDSYVMTRDLLLKEFIPNRVLMAAKTADDGFPLLREKQSLADPSIYLCRNYTCLKPVFSVKDLIWLINNPENP